MVHKTAFKIMFFLSPKRTDFGDYSKAMQGPFLLCRVTFRELVLPSNQAVLKETGRDCPLAPEQSDKAWLQHTGFASHVLCGLHGLLAVLGHTS